VQALIGASSILSSGDLGKKVRRKGAERIVARTHDRDAIPALRNPGNVFAAFLSIRDMFSMAPRLGDPAGQFGAAHALVGRAAEIDGVTQDDPIVRAKLFSKDSRQFPAHLPQRAVAVGLEEGDDPAGWARSVRKVARTLSGL